MNKEQKSKIMKDWWINHPEYRRPKATEATKEKMRLAKLGKKRPPFTQEHKDKIKMAMLNRHKVV